MAIAIDPSLQNSNVATSVYVIQTGATSFNFGNGFSSTAGLTLNGSAVATNGQLQLTTGGTIQAGSVFWNVPINIQAFTTNFEFQLTNAKANGFTFTIQNVGPTALGGNSAGLGYQDIQKSVAVKFNFYNYTNPTSGASSGSNSTGVYTNGQPPLAPNVDITPSGIQLASGDKIQAQITYDGATLTLNLLDTVTNDKFTMSQAINIPQTVGGNTAYVGFTGGTGGLSSIQKMLTWTYAIPSFLLSGSPLNPIAPGGSATSNLTVTPTAGFTGTVALTCAVANGPAGATSSPTCSVTQPAAIAGTQPAASTLTINTNATTTPGTYIANVTGKSGTLTQTTSVVITVSNPNFSLSGTAVSIASPGAGGTSTITVTPSGGFTGSVTLACAITNSPVGSGGCPDLLGCSTGVDLRNSACVLGPHHQYQGNHHSRDLLGQSDRQRRNPDPDHKRRDHHQQSTPNTNFRADKHCRQHRVAWRKRNLDHHRNPGRRIHRQCDPCLRHHHQPRRSNRSADLLCCSTWSHLRGDAGHLRAHHYNDGEHSGAPQSV